MVHFRRLPVLETAASEISSQTGNPVFAVQMDIRDPSAVATAFDACEAKFGLPNIIINNAAGNFISVSHTLPVYCICPNTVRSCRIPQKFLEKSCFYFLKILTKHLRFASEFFKALLSNTFLGWNFEIRLGRVWSNVFTAVTLHPQMHNSRVILYFPIIWRNFMNIIGYSNEYSLNYYNQ